MEPWPTAVIVSILAQLSTIPGRLRVGRTLRAVHCAQSRRAAPPAASAFVVLN